MTSAHAKNRGKIAHAEAAVSRAMEGMQAALEDLAVQRLVAIQKRNPASNVSFACAMGTWSFYRERKNESARRYLGEHLYADAKLDEQFSRIQSEFGWGCIPVVALSFRPDGSVERKYEW